MTFAPADVAAVRFVCERCGNEYVWRGSSECQEPPTACPFTPCGTQWDGSPEWGVARDLARNIYRAAARKTKPPIRIHLEVPLTD